MKKAGNGFGFHGLGVEIARIDPSKRNLRRTIAFRAGGLDAPVVYRGLNTAKHLVRHIRQMTGRTNFLGYGLRKFPRKIKRQCGLQCLLAVLFALLTQGFENVRLR